MAADKGNMVAYPRRLPVRPLGNRRVGRVERNYPLGRRRAAGWLGVSPAGTSSRRPSWPVGCWR